MSSASAPLDAAVVARVRASFARQGAVATLGAELGAVSAGRVAIALRISRTSPSRTVFSTQGSSSPRSTAPAGTPR
jgi:hypothetical protein